MVARPTTTLVDSSPSGDEVARLFVDGQIAAIAYVNEMTLVTVNGKDFARFKGVDVENWSKRRR